MDDMSERVPEVVGFLCRWTLLALATATILAATCAVLAAMAGAPGNVRARLVIADVLFEQAGEKLTWAPCYQAPKARGGIGPRVMTKRPDGKLIFFASGIRAFYLPIPGDWPQRSRLRVRGVPYSSLAFEAGWMLIHPTPRGRRVYAFDATLAGVLRKAPASPWHACLRDAAARGGVAFFSGGPPENIPVLRRELLEYYGTIPLLYTRSDRSDALPTLIALSRKLNARKTPDRPMPIVITADAQLAQRCAAQGFPTHLVAHRPNRLKPRANLQIHPTFTELRATLATGATRRARRPQ